MKRIRQKAVNALLVMIMYAGTAALFYAAWATDYHESDSLIYLRVFVFIFFAPMLIKYLVHLIVAPLYPLVEKVRGKSDQNTKSLSVTVIIPAYNEEVGIKATIRSVVETKYQNLQLIVMNDGSTDGTEVNVLAAFDECRDPADKYGQKLIYKKLVNGGKARALNESLAIATGDIIVTIDADSVMDPLAVQKLVDRYADERVASVAGNVIIGNRHAPIGFLQQLEYLYGFYFKRADSIFNAVYIVGGAAASYRRSVVIEVGGFDENSVTEDIELSTRLQDRGYRVRYAADAIVYTEGPSDFKGLCQQRLRWKFGRLLTFLKYRKLFFSMRRDHNVYLTMLVLPVALLAEALLFFEWFLLIVFYGYIFYTNDYVPLVVFIAILTLVIVFQVLIDAKAAYHKNIIPLAPIAWILFYVIDIVEYQALLRALWRLVRNKGLAWQRWNRTGVFG